MKETTTTTTTTVRRKFAKVPKPKPRLVQRTRTVKITNVPVRVAKTTARRIVVPVKRAEVISVRTTKVLPVPATANEIVVRRERQKVPNLR